MSATDSNEVWKRAPRSLLFCPGHDSAKIAKALRAGADAVILDLEDAVAPDQKANARDVVARVLAERPKGRVVVRVNDAGSPHHFADLAASVQAGADAIMLPKCSGKIDLQRLSDRIDVLETAYGRPSGTVGVIPLVSENASSLLALNYAGAPRRLLAIGFAAEDLAADLGVAARSAAGFTPLLTSARQAVAIAAAAAGAPALDTPFPGTSDLEGLRREAAEAAALGFVGKLCIHPAQIATVHAALRPADDRIAWAKSVIAELDDGRVGVGVVNGAMVDTAHLPLARRLLSAAGDAS